MPIHLIASDETLLSQWRDSIAQLGLPLQGCQPRRPGQRLATDLQALLPVAPDDIVVLACAANDASHDLSDLDDWLRKHPQLNVLLLSEDKSHDFLLQAMRCGVREVLTLPLPPQDLALSLKRWSERLTWQRKDTRPTLPAADPPKASSPASPGRLVAFLGCKGGNGTSFIAANMAHILASEFDKKCAFVDLDLQCGDASFYLGSGANRHSLVDLTRQIDRLDAQLMQSCLYAVTPRLNLLAAPHSLENAMAITAQDIEKVITLVRSLHEHVVVDLPRNLNALSLKVLDMADVVYIVMQNHTPDVRDAQRLVGTLRSLGIHDSKMRLLVNRYTSGSWVSLDELQKAVGLNVHQTIPSHPQSVGEALHTGQALAAVSDHNGVMQALRQTTGALLDTTPAKHRHWLQRWMGQSA